MSGAKEAAEDTAGEAGLEEHPLDDLLLTLDTLVKRPVIDVDGERVEMLNPEMLSVAENHRLGVLGQRIDKLQQSSSEKDAEKLDRAVDETCRLVLPDIDPKLYAKLSGVQKMAVLEVFMGLRLAARTQLAGAVAKGFAGRIGEKPPAGSPASTGERPATG
jgi:hypothetical protein